MSYNDRPGYVVDGLTITRPCNDAIRSYEQAKTFWDTRRKRKLGNNTYLVETGEGIGVRLHTTVVVEFTPDRAILNSGGWKTSTTKDRIDAYMPIGHLLWQDGGVWFVGKGYEDPEPVVFADGMYLQTQASVWCNTGGPAKAHRLFRKSVRTYAKRFVVALARGQVPKPSSADCLVCRSGQKQSDHIRSHLEENYFVPSLCQNACNEFGVSQAARTWLWEIWAGSTNGHTCWEATAKEQIENAIRRYCYRCCGSCS
jgi:hypothetical protein